MNIKTLLILSFLIAFGSVAQAQISTMEFVQILNDNDEDAWYYYKNNWQALREKAIEKKYIKSYEFMQCEYSEEAPFHIILVTTYKDSNQYAEREEHFAELIKESGGLKLLSDKKPGEFRQSVFVKENIQHK